MCVRGTNRGSGPRQPSLVANDRLDGVKVTLCLLKVT